MANIRKAVIMARRYARMNQKELAAEAGISASQLRNIEKGRSNASVETLEKIAKATRTKLVITFE